MDGWKSASSPMEKHDVAAEGKGGARGKGEAREALPEIEGKVVE